MATHWSSDNRMVVLGLGIGLIGLHTLIHHSLQEVRESHKYKPPPIKPQYIDQNTEDKIPNRTLDVLRQSSNDNVKDVAKRIIIDRALYDGETIWLICEDAKQGNPVALRALRDLIVTQNALDHKYIPSIVKAACGALKKDARETEQPAYDREYDVFQHLGDTVNLSLNILVCLCLERVDIPKSLAISGIFVPQWLAKLNWGEGDERRENFTHFHKRYEDIPGHNLYWLVDKVSAYEKGLRRLQEAGLVKEPSDIGITSVEHGYTRRRRYADSQIIVNGVPMMAMTNEGALDPGAAILVEVIRSIPGEMFTVDGPFNSLPVLAPRQSHPSAESREQSAEERRLSARRNREAMVLSSGDGPITVEDIIERGDRSNDN